MQTWNACSSVMIHSNVFRYFVTSNRIMIDKCYHKEVENVVFRYFWSCFQQSAPRIKASDPAHADVFNAVFRQLINNDVALMEAASMFAGEKQTG